MLQARDTAKHGTDHRYSQEDARFLLKVITEEWRVFKDKLSRAEQSFASELREVAEPVGAQRGVLGATIRTARWTRWSGC